MGQPDLDHLININFFPFNSKSVSTCLRNPSKTAFLEFRWNFQCVWWHCFVKKGSSPTHRRNELKFLWPQSHWLRKLMQAIYGRRLQMSTGMDLNLQAQVVMKQLYESLQLVELWLIDCRSDRQKDDVGSFFLLSINRVASWRRKSIVPDQGSMKLDGPWVRWRMSRSDKETDAVVLDVVRFSR